MSQQNLTAETALDIADAVRDLASPSAKVQGMIDEMRRLRCHPVSMRDFSAIIGNLDWDKQDSDLIRTALKEQFHRLPQRGQYSLPGVVVDAEPTTSASEADVNTETEKDAEPTTASPIETSSSENGVSWTPPRAQVSEAAGLYLEDVGLRRLAVSGSNCFGVAFSSGAQQCQVCPLASFCAEASLSHVATVAAQLDQQTNEAIARAQREADRRALEAKREQERAEREKARAAGMSSSPSSSSGNPFGGGTGTGADPKAKAGAKKLAAGTKCAEMEIPFGGVCSHCDQDIAENTWAVHVFSGGMFHRECVDLSEAIMQDG